MSAKKIFIAGFGGQGVLLIGQMLAYAAMFEEKEVTWMPSYGPEMRGGTANCTVCIDDEKTIASPLVTKCDYLVTMNGPSLMKFENMLSPGGQLFINSSIVTEIPKRDDVEVNYVDCLRLAQESGNSKAANMVMLGAIIEKSQVVKKKTMEKVFEKIFTGGKAKFIPSNIKAIDLWKQ